MRKVYKEGGKKEIERSFLDGVNGEWVKQRN
jgi:hypothetical protein